MPKKILLTLIGLLAFCSTPGICADKARVNVVLALDDKERPQLVSFVCEELARELNKGNDIKAVDRSPKAIEESKRTGKKLEPAEWCISGGLTVMKFGGWNAVLSLRFVRFSNKQIVAAVSANAPINGEVEEPDGKSEEEFAKTPTGEAIVKLVKDAAKKLEKEVQAGKLQ